MCFSNISKVVNALGMLEAIPGEIEQARCLTGILYSGIQECSKEYSRAMSVLKEALEICERYPHGTKQIKNVCLEILGQIR